MDIGTLIKLFKKSSFICFINLSCYYRFPWFNISKQIDMSLVEQKYNSLRNECCILPKDPSSTMPSNSLSAL